MKSTMGAICVVVNNQDCQQLRACGCYIALSQPELLWCVQMNEDPLNAVDDGSARLRATASNPWCSLIPSAQPRLVPLLLVVSRGEIQIVAVSRSQQRCVICSSLNPRSAK